MSSLETKFALFVWIGTVICVTLVVIPSILILIGKPRKGRHLTKND